MNYYTTPKIDILLFDEEEILTASNPNTFAEFQLNKYMLGGGVNSASNTSIAIEKVQSN